MNNPRVLLAYVTKAGSTAETAVRLGAVIAQRGFAVDVLPLDKVGDLAAYSTVILGSAVRMGMLLPEMTKFIQAHENELKQKTFNIFIVCMTMHEETPEALEKSQAILDPVRTLLTPASEGLFAGTMNRKKLSIADRLIANMVKVPEGDFRDWEKIEGWAQSVPCA